jgi:hypothetical protein
MISPVIVLTTILARRGAGFSLGKHPHQVSEVQDRQPPRSGGCFGKRTHAISFTAWAYTPGSVHPNAALWIDSRRVKGRLDIGPDNAFALERVRRIGAARLRPGRRVTVTGVRSGDGGVFANAWILTVR